MVIRTDQGTAFETKQGLQDALLDIGNQNDEDQRARSFAKNGHVEKFNRTSMSKADIVCE
ncbi:hypothetical protein DPMN_085251 [Dreissena polymorpha]|uniref:Uncharacterized protein n=1 Tax=Dreissena polymorpha TaxID=45954 RepID=A0A9D3YEP0_DREPO|nr:hypothetical protein DPMN_085246 [Dreissena polymorpha]KAH3697741.1 hypothetical protein DPMN_085251 [Dreissena polymorpha]